MIESYLALARESLTVAKKLMGEHRRHTAFNIEQAAKKLLKAVLTAEKIPFTTGHHQLGALARLMLSDPPSALTSWHSMNSQAL